MENLLCVCVWLLRHSTAASDIVRVNQRAYYFKQRMREKYTRKDEGTKMQSENPSFEHMPVVSLSFRISLYDFLSSIRSNSISVHRQSDTSKHPIYTTAFNTGAHTRARVEFIFFPSNNRPTFASSAHTHTNTRIHRAVVRRMELHSIFSVAWNGMVWHTMLEKFASYDIVLA